MEVSLESLPHHLHPHNDLMLQLKQEQQQKIVFIFKFCVKCQHGKDS